MFLSVPDIVIILSCEPSTASAILISAFESILMRLILDPPGPIIAPPISLGIVTFVVDTGPVSSASPVTNSQLPINASHVPQASCLHNDSLPHAHLSRGDSFDSIERSLKILETVVEAAGGLLLVDCHVEVGLAKYIQSPLLLCGILKSSGYGQVLLGVNQTLLKFE